MALEEKIVDGVEYFRRTEYGEFWTIQDYAKAPDLSVPHVICKCGNTLFRIWTASYDTWAVCPQCGHGESIHSG